MDDNFFDKMKEIEIKSNSIMIWYECVEDDGPCSGSGGEWFWCNDKKALKDFLQGIIQTVISDLTNSEDVFSVDLTNIKELEKVLPEGVNAKKIERHIIDLLTDRESQTIEEIDSETYQILKEFKKDWIEYKVYVFKSPFDARSLLEAHGQEYDTDNLTEVFTEDCIF